MLKSALIVLMYFFSTSLVMADPIVSYRGSDHALSAAMNRAVADARRTMSEFVSAYASGVGEKHMIKLPFPTGDGGDEHVWLAVTKLSKSTGEGIVINNPDRIAGLQRGDVRAFAVRDASDWVYEKNGRFVGGRTMVVMIPYLPPDAAAELRLKFGL